MTPNDKMKSIVFTVTTALIFFCWTKLTDLIKENLFFGIPLSAVISLGTYRLVLKLVEVVILKISLIKKWIYGNTYLEGKWIGFYIGVDEKPRFYLEYYEQDLEGVLIRGWAYNENGTFKGTWVTDKVYINKQKGTITYTYETDMINSTNRNQGLASFDFVRNNKKQAPSKMIGFSSDIFMSKKLKSFERKLNKEEIKLDDSEVLILVKEFYEEHVKFI